jgi:Tfp pilus assembly protein PilV
MIFRMMSANLERENNNQRGFALLEALICLLLFAVIGMGFAKSQIDGLKMRQRVLHRSLALQVASDEMERQARLRANNLVAGVTTSTVTKNLVQFTQVVTIVAATATEFNVTVVVTDKNNSIGGSVQLSNKLIPYGST